MTSASFQTVLIENIAVMRDARQRRELPAIAELAASIAETGLINPPVITREFILVAGERRLEACRSLGWDSIPVQFTDELDPTLLHLIELEENVKRVDLTWNEHNDAVAEYHRLRAAADPDWSKAKTARQLGVTDSAVSRHLLVAQERAAKPEAFKDADKLTSAINIATRQLERRRAGAEKKLTAVPPTLQKEKIEAAGLEYKEPTPPARRASIECASFLEWAQTPQPHLYNLIHCDFPYGVNVGDKVGQGNAQSRGQYEDTPEVYFALLQCMADTIDNWCSPSAHLIFWFSMKFFEETKSLLSEQGWRVDPFPLVWHKSDNAGIIPDANRGGRRTYETAFFASRGDRKIIKPVGNSFSGPTTKEFHTSEKPAAMLTHFFRMLCDEHSLVLDPTCGSGMAVRVAEGMGAERALGLELNEEYADAARRNLSL